ncbi:hypothetical protein [Nitratireductor sp. ZSWI3]|uniref:hypothetical protein n=1 Tax=Nitratireductor sp. ZSWI3 TaxID=2966359 RepID=UPI0021505FD7|nr:hypothetical protein [Nitratireductor sp. ZSWI3]MCR4269146.1 hypothetical protein [Nitratireductor sp. ZSWI3]
MSRVITPSSKTLKKSIEVCIANGARLLDDAMMLEFEKPPSSRLYLVLIAQEEFAKAFMLRLVAMDIFPLSRPILRAMNDHTCKQLVGMLMDYMIMHWEELEELHRMIDEDLEMGDDHFPFEIASALDLLRYEKIARWESGNRVYVETSKPDPVALRVAGGEKDRRKQDALYVRINPDGSVKSTPIIVSDDEMGEESERAERYLHFVRDTMTDGPTTHRQEKTIAALRLLFTHHPPT